MVDIKVIASGSKGNCYYISDYQTEILLDLGIPFKEVQKALNFQTSNIKSVLITHEHIDHVKGLKTALNRGMTFYMSEGTKNDLKESSLELEVIKHGVQFKIGTLTILPFDVKHDAAEPLGFLISSENGGKLLYVTDAYLIKYNFKGLTHILVECNYDIETLNKNCENGVIGTFLRNRVLKSHLSLENVIRFLKSSDISKVEEIHLIHLSDKNANREKIKKEVARATGKLIKLH